MEVETLREGGREGGEGKEYGRNDKLRGQTDVGRQGEREGGREGGREGEGCFLPSFLTHMPRSWLEVRRRGREGGRPTVMV